MTVSSLSPAPTLEDDRIVFSQKMSSWLSSINNSISQINLDANSHYITVASIGGMANRIRASNFLNDVSVYYTEDFASVLTNTLYTSNEYNRVIGSTQPLYSYPSLSGYPTHTVKLTDYSKSSNTTTGKALFGRIYTSQTNGVTYKFLEIIGAYGERLLPNTLNNWLIEPLAPQTGFRFLTLPGALPSNNFKARVNYGSCFIKDSKLYVANANRRWVSFDNLQTF